MADFKESLFPILKTTAQLGAENCIKDIKEKRNRKFEAAVEKVQRRRRFLFCPVTREKAERLAEDAAFDPPEWKIYAWGDLGRATDILKACKVVAGDLVYLTAEDAALVSDHMPKEAMIERKSDHTAAN